MDLGVSRYGTAPIDVVMDPGHPLSEEDEILRGAMLTVYSRFHGLSGFIPGPDGKLWLRSIDCDRVAETLMAQLACEQRGIAWAANGMGDVYSYAGAAVPLSRKARSKPSATSSPTRNTPRPGAG